MQAIIVAATIVIAVATVCYTIYAHKQWQVMTETLKQSKAALDATIDNFRLEQRAWVGPTQAFPAEYLNGNKKVYVEEGQQIKGGVFITNSGRTPARNLNTLISLISLKADAKLDPKYMVDATTQPSNTVMQPGMTFSLRPLPIKGIVSKADIDDLASGRYIIYMFGLITYEDIFGHPHSTKFCMYVTPDFTTFRGCSAYNEAD